jgi:hypothetical protein
MTVYVEDMADVVAATGDENWILCANRQHPAHLHIQRLQREIDILRHHRRPPCMPHELLCLLNDEIDPVLYIPCNGSTCIIRDFVDTTRFCDVLERS